MTLSLSIGFIAVCKWKLGAVFQCVQQWWMSLVFVRLTSASLYIITRAI